MISFRGDDHQRRSTESRCQSGSNWQGDTGSADIRPSLCDYKLKAPEARQSGASSPKCKRGSVAGACLFSPSAAENVGIARNMTRRVREECLDGFMMRSRVVPTIDDKISVYSYFRRARSGERGGSLLVKSTDQLSLNQNLADIHYQRGR